MAGLKAVLFDLDDTLVPEMDAEREGFMIGCRLAADKYGVDPEAMLSSIYEAAKKLWGQWTTPGTYSSIAYSGWEGLWGPPDVPDDGLGNDPETLRQYKQDAWDEVLRIHGVEDAELRDEIIETHRIARISRLKPFPAVIDVLERVKRGHRLGLVTNGSPAVQRFKLSQSGLTHHFEVIVASGDVGVSKPDPLPFTTALDMLGTSARDAVMIGNSWTSDIQGAANLGMRSIWLNAEGKERPNTGGPPTDEISSLSEVPESIHRI
jgi:putative hydrolase of the HAD superfamily